MRLARTSRAGEEEEEVAVATDEAQAAAAATGRSVGINGVEVGAFFFFLLSLGPDNYERQPHSLFCSVTPITLIKGGFV